MAILVNKFKIDDFVTYFDELTRSQLTVKIMGLNYEHYHVQEIRSGLKWLIKLYVLDAKGFKYLKFNKIWDNVNENI